MDFLSRNSQSFKEASFGVKFLSLIGGIVMAKKMCKTLSFLYEQFLQKGHNLINRYGANSYVVITGCTSGIGESFAFNFAKKGFNLVLIGRSEQKLNELKQKISAECPNISMEIVIADFVKGDNIKFYEEIVDKIKHLDISILVNNVGVAYGNFFFLQDMQQIQETIVTNIYPQVYLTRLLLPQMLKRQNPKSLVVNMASISGVWPNPLTVVYNASKAFNRYFSLSLNSDFGNKIDVIALSPGFVKTPMIKAVQPAPASWKMCDPEEFVLTAFKKFGLKNHDFPHIKHWFQDFINHNDFIWNYKVKSSIRNALVQAARAQKQKQN